MKLGVTKLLPASGSSVNGTESGSPNPVDGGIGSRFGSYMSSTLATGRLDSKVMLSAVKSCFLNPLPLSASSVNRPDPGYPDPVDGGHDYYFRRGEPPA